MPRAKKETVKKDVKLNTPSKPRGRPTKYKKEFCDTLMDLFSMGGDPPEFCAHVGISERTFYNWRKDYGEFDETFQRADAIAKSFYLKEFRLQGLTKDKYPNSSQLFTYVRQRWPDTFGKQAENSTNVTNNHLTINSLDGKTFLELQEELQQLTQGITIDVEKG